MEACHWNHVWDLTGYSMKDTHLILAPGYIVRLNHGWCICSIPLAWWLLPSNKPDLGFTRSGHLAAGYNYLISHDLRFRMEVYYEYLFDLPVKSTIPQYTVITRPWILCRPPVQWQPCQSWHREELWSGIHLWKIFLAAITFSFLTASIFNSTYQAYDKVIRSTAFNGNYAVNATGGYEFKIGKRKLVSCHSDSGQPGPGVTRIFRLMWKQRKLRTRQSWTGNILSSPGNPDISDCLFASGSNGTVKIIPLNFSSTSSTEPTTRMYTFKDRRDHRSDLQFLQHGIFPDGTWRIQF